MAGAGQPKGIRPHGDRIQIRFTWKGVELRPTLDLKPNARNLSHAERVRRDVMNDIRTGTLDLAKYFPDYRFMERHQQAPQATTFTQVKEKFLAWAEVRQKHSSVYSLKCKIEFFWEPAFGEKDIRAIRYKDLSDHVGSKVWGSNKTFNNYLSAVREMFSYAVDHEYLDENPTTKLKGLEVQQPEPNPYNVTEAEALIAQAAKTHGRIDAIYWHLSFLLGWRPGEAISVKWSDWNKVTGRITIQRNRTVNKDSKQTKTSKVRHIDLPPAALPLLQELRALTELRSKHLFVDFETGEQIQNSTVIQERWVTLHKLAGVGYREPYQCRHSSVSWKLMAGLNQFKIARSHGHAPATMYKVYAHWVETDSDETEIDRIRAFHGWKTSGVAAERRSG